MGDGHHRLTDAQLIALRETSAAYGCALLTARGIEPRMGLVNVALAGDEIATLRDPLITDQAEADEHQLELLTRIAHALHGRIGFREQVYAVAVQHQLARDGIESYLHECDAPAHEYVVALLIR